LTDIHKAIEAKAGGAIEAHDIRTRHAEIAIFIYFQLGVPGETTIFQAHRIYDRIEKSLKALLDDAKITIHVEPEHKIKPSGAIVPN
jgi:divalent metal cation (Fe/Co/Zn/Cd) transporter